MSTPEDKQRQIELAKELTGLVKEIKEISKTDSEDTQSPIEKFLKNAQTALSAIVGIVALLTATGFIVVNVYLSKFTDAFGYNVIATQYISAGIAAWVISPIIWIILAIIFLAGYGLAASVRDIFRNPKHKKNLLDSFFEGLAPINALVENLYGIIIVGTIAAFAIYGYLIYEKIPRILGGGQQSTIIIVFKDETTASLLGLPVDPQEAKRTLEVKRLADLTDGLLIWFEQEKRAAIVKSDTILGIIDTQQEQVNTPTFSTSPATLAPTDTPAGTPNETATPEATAP